ncbi:N-acetyl-gamma-glutamyl-phosphate reductase [bacterium]|nr:N-acetyl-gamma-glutamyl-phosphate reductase [bacterium]
MIKARVIGAGGYGGAGILDLLIGHPEAEVVDVVDVENVGMPISQKFPHLKGFCNLVITSPDEAKWDGGVDVVFTATPDGVGMRYAKQCLESGTKLVDFSGDFRFDTAEAYAQYAQRIGRDPGHKALDLLQYSCYGLAELHRQEIPSAKIVGNPGCFAVSTILGLAPAVKAGLIDLDTLICDAKTGVSGAGIKPSPTFHYPSRYENMNAYKIAGHQHCMEVERELGLLAGHELVVTLTTQVIPLARGIMSTLYGRIVRDGLSAQDVFEIYEGFYRGSKFVHVVPQMGAASNNDVRGSNFCVLWVNVDPRTHQLIVVSHIDNLVKGQAGSAVQNMNLLFGLDEGAGLMRPAFYP